MEGHELHPHVDSQGVHWFDEDEVDELAKEGVSGHEPAIAAREREGDRSALRSVTASAVVERRQHEHDLRNAEERNAALKSELDAARARMAELLDEHRKMRSILRTLGRLILDMFDQKMLVHVEPTLLTVIRASASHVD
jgi:hypothetical protein